MSIKGTLPFSIKQRQQFAGVMLIIVFGITIDARETYSTWKNIATSAFIPTELMSLVESTGLLPTLMLVAGAILTLFFLLDLWAFLSLLRRELWAWFYILFLAAYYAVSSVWSSQWELLIFGGISTWWLWKTRELFTSDGRAWSLQQIIWALQPSARKPKVDPTSPSHPSEQVVVIDPTKLDQ